MLMRRNAPGPTLSSSSVVSCSKQGEGWHWSIGCCSSTPKGAAQRASSRVPARATARACTSTESMPMILLKKPGAERLPVTTIVSSATTSPVTVTDSRPPPFFAAYSAASAPAPPGSSGSAWAPARAAESTELWSARSARYHEPTSIAAAAIPSRTTRNTRRRTTTWPDSRERVDEP